MELRQLNAAPADDVRAALLACCASPSWVDAVLAGRPYADLAALTMGSARALASLTWDQLRVAIDAHPRIGERLAGAGPSATREAAWSAAEQSGMATASDEVRSALVEANQAYEQRFGHVFLIFATGRSDTELLAAARARLDNDDATERAIVRDQLTRIVSLRLGKLVGAA